MCPPKSSSVCADTDLMKAESLQEPCPELVTATQEFPTNSGLAQVVPLNGLLVRIRHYKRASTARKTHREVSRWMGVQKCRHIQMAPVSSAGTNTAWNG